MTTRIEYDTYQPFDLNDDTADFPDKNGGFVTITDEPDQTAVSFLTYSGETPGVKTLFLRKPNAILHINDITITRI